MVLGWMQKTLHSHFKAMPRANFKMQTTYLPYTLGFRGEALPSIGAVSHAGIISRVRGAINGAEIKIDGGVLGKLRNGVRLKVRRLRCESCFLIPLSGRSFVKSIPTEMAYISEVLTKFSLSYPAIHFTLMHNNRTVFNLPTVQDTAERIATFLAKR